MSFVEIKEKILDIFFPPRCMVCGEVVSRGIPCECINQLEKIQFPSGAINFVQEGKLHEYVTAIWVCYSYQEPIKKMISRFKFEDEPELSAQFGDMLYTRFVEDSLQQRFDFLLAIPVSEETRKERGYSQTELLAKQLSEKCQVPILQNVLVKTKETAKQTSLSRAGRLTNVKGAFTVLHPEQVKGKTICLVDDIITTGSTLQECAKTLLNAGAENIYSICIASTPAKHS